MITETDVNKPKVVAELEQIVAAYERALVANDVKALQDFFWPSPLALRFGATEQLYGAEAIATFRQNRVINFSERKALRQQLVAIGPDLGIATLEFSVTIAGKSRHGRQSQVWVRFAKLGWRIVSAHVSHKVDQTAALPDLQAAGYVAQASRVLDLPLDAADIADVVRNMQVMADVAEPLMAFASAECEQPALGTAS